MLGLRSNGSNLAPVAIPPQALRWALIAICIAPVRIARIAVLASHVSLARQWRRPFLLFKAKTPRRQGPTADTEFERESHDRPARPGVGLARCEAPSSLREAGSDEGGRASNDAASSVVFAMPPT